MTVFLRLCFVVVLLFWGNSASANQCKSPEEIHQSKMERYAMDRVPSILDECGIGAMIDLCGNPWLKAIGKQLGLCGGSSGGGGGQSNFCDFSFDLKNLKKIYKDYKSYGALPSEGSNVDEYGVPKVLHALAGSDNYSEVTAAVKPESAKTAFEVLGIETN